MRGDDSTGVIAVETDTTFHIMKEAVEAAWFVPQLQYGTLGRKLYSTGKALIGHNRKGTVGKIKDDTAHPFVVDETFAMVHNGTLNGHNLLAKTEVDSEALAIVLAKAFEEEDYKGALEEILPRVYGAYAVAMYDQRHNVVRLLRNKERPLAMVETTNAWYFASEGLMLHWVLARNGYTAKELETLKSVPEDTLVTFDLDLNTCVEEKITVKKYTPHTPMVVGGATHTKTYTKVTVTEGLSKNEFKRIRKSVMGTRMEFWADDYVEKNFPKTYEEGETVFNLMGNSDWLQDLHTVHAVIDINDLKLSPVGLTERLWVGRVEAMTYNTKSKTMSIHVTDAIPLPISYKKMTPAKPDIVDATYIQRKLDEKDKQEAQALLH